MSALREAAQQALDAMSYTGMNVGKFNRINAACAALKAALEQTEACRHAEQCNEEGWCTNGCEDIAALAEHEQKPWRCACGANLYIDENGAPRSKA